MRPKKSKHDWIALALFVSLIVIGWLMIYAAGHNEQEGLGLSMSTPAGKQLVFIGIAAVLFVLVNIIDVKFWRTFAYPTYALALLLLVLVLLIGATIKGSTSWFSIGGFSLQPSEFAKFGTCLALASFLSYYRTDLRKTKYQLGACALLGVPMALIMLQPDAGSALVFTSFLILLYREGMPRPIIYRPLVIYRYGDQRIAVSCISCHRHGAAPRSCPVVLAAGSTAVLDRRVNSCGGCGAGLCPAPVPWPVLLFNTALLSIAAFRRIKARLARHVVLVVPGVILSIGLAFMVNYAFVNILEPHQQDRINVWLNPDQCDPQGSLYNVLQSKIAIGSGGVMGKGFLQGTMTNLNYVPEQTTDFIFSTVGEEQGFIGSAGIILIFAMLLIRIISMAERMRSAFSRHYAYGVLGVLFFHVFINIGMTMGIVPIIGIPLPFLSYGGSSLLAFSIMFGVLFKMDRERFAA